MINFDKYISEHGVAKVEGAIKEAESFSACEIVPVIMDHADEYLHGSVTFGFIFSILCLTLSWFILPPNELMQYVWPSAIQWEYLVFMLLVILIGFTIGVFIAQKIPALKLFFISPKEMQKHVINKSLFCFNHYNVSKTRDNTGIVIVVSLYEKMVHVHGDTNVSKYFDQACWNSICAKIIHGIKNNNLAQGLHDGIVDIGALVKEKLPIQPNDTNELANKLYFHKSG